MATLLNDATSSSHNIKDVSGPFQILNPALTPSASQARKGRTPRKTIIATHFKTLPTARNQPISDGEVVAGNSAILNNESAKGMLQARFQKIRREVGVGDIAQEVTVQYGGITDLYKDNVKDQITGLKLDMELICLSNNDSLAETVSSQPRYWTRGLCKWLSIGGDPSDLPIPAAAKCPTANKITRATPAVMTEDDFRNICASIWGARHEMASLTAYCTATAQLRVSDFGRCDESATSTRIPIRQFNSNKSDTMEVSVKFYNSDFGRIKLVPHVSLPKMSNGTSDFVHILGIDSEYTEINEVRAPRFKDLEDRGGGPNGFIDAIFVNNCLNPQAHGAIHATYA